MALSVQVYLKIDRVDQAEKQLRVIPVPYHSHLIYFILFYFISFNVDFRGRLYWSSCGAGSTLFALCDLSVLYVCAAVSTLSDLSPMSVLLGAASVGGCIFGVSSAHACMSAAF